MIRKPTPKAPALDYEDRRCKNELAVDGERLKRQRRLKTYLAQLECLAYRGPAISRMVATRLGFDCVGEDAR